MTENGIRVRDNIYNFSKGFPLFFTNKDVTEKDIKSVENKIIRFLRDIVYKRERDNKSKRAKLIKRLAISIHQQEKILLAMTIFMILLKKQKLNLVVE